MWICISVCVSVLKHVMNVDDKKANEKLFQYYIFSALRSFTISRTFFRAQEYNGLVEVALHHKEFYECKDITFHCSISKRYRALTVI